MNTPNPLPPPAPITPWWKREPVALFGSLQGLFASVLTVLFAFDIWSPTEEQLASLTGLYTAATAVLTFVVRGQVTPISSVELTKEDADFIREIQKKI